MPKPTSTPALSLSRAPAALLLAAVLFACGDATESGADAGGVDGGGEPATCSDAGGYWIEPGTLGAGFTTHCATCHGASGQGQGGYPSLVGTVEEAWDFVGRVRAGGVGMPAFEASALTDEELLATWATLNDKRFFRVLPGCSQGTDGGNPDAGTTYPVPDYTPGQCAPTVTARADTGVAPTGLSKAFTQTCAGCHGASGQGEGGIPALPGELTLGQYMSVARYGKGPRMPPFSAERVTDWQLASDWAFLKGWRLVESTAAACASAPREPAARRWTAESLQQASASGLAAWRTPDGEGAACASCHGPDPIDLAFIGYRDGDVLRRALLHVDAPNAWRVVDWVHALRARHAIVPKDRMTFRPLQPGGEVLPGATPADRDALFGQRLAQAVPSLAGAPVRTLAAAEAARDGLLALDPRTMPVGITFNRWTEDRHHGEAHRTFSDWMPDRPHLPVDSAARDALFALHDTYLANPSWDSLLAILQAEKNKTYIPGLENVSNARELFQHKHRSVLFAQHLFRAELLGLPGLSSRGTAPFPFDNSPWMVADRARTSQSAISTCKLDGLCVGFPSLPEDISASATQGLHTELQLLKLPWFYLGWQFDFSLYQTNGSNATRSSEYFTGELYALGYYNHLTFMRFRKNLSMAYEPGALPEGERRLAHTDSNNFGYFLAYGRGMGTKTPPDASARELYAKLLANSLRMTLVLMTDEVKRTGRAHGIIDPATLSTTEPYGLRLFARPTRGSGIGAFLSWLHGVPIDGTPDSTWPQDAVADKQLFQELATALDAACEARPLAYKQSPYPGHCGYVP
jgi:mono/diheme cytochrome c family protein